MLRFDDHHELVAKRNGKATCGPHISGAPHHVRVGDTIGWARRYKETSVVCASCWAKWKAEVEEEDRILGVSLSAPECPY